MFCDLVGSTALSQTLDPEDLRTLIKQYQELCQHEVAKYEGYIAQYLGDGILVYFGYPVAHENDAHRAVSSGMGILNALVHLNEQLKQSIGQSISIWIGIHTGLVVIGSMGQDQGSQQLALGAAPNIASKIEGFAAPNSMVISDATYELVKDHFSCTDLGNQEIKGVDGPLKVFQVTSGLQIMKRLGSLSTVSDQALLGRNEEIQQLLKYWEQAKSSHSQIVMISAEPGVGKSRLIQSFVSKIAHEKDLWLIPNQCSPYHRKTAFYPFVAGIKSLAMELKGDESNSQQLEKLEEFLSPFDFQMAEIVPLFAGIMSIPLTGSDYRPPQFSLEQQKHKIISALLAMIVKRAVDKNVLLIFEDLHWVDPSSLEVISRLISQSPNIKMMAILSFRTEFEPPWRLKPHLISLPLTHLPEEAVIDIINRIAKNKEIPEKLVKQIVQKTDGVPLFVEELTKMVLNSEMVTEREDHYELNQSHSQLAIPNTLHDSLLARLDHMAVARKVAQVGSVIGREFGYPLVLAASGMEEIELKNCLDQLVRAELLVQTGVGQEARFKFRHALIRDAAYQSLLKSMQQELHKQVASILTAKEEEHYQERPATIAYHLEKGGQWEQATSYWIQAAHQARQYQAFDEALGYLQRALDLLPRLENPEARELQILEVQAPLHLMTAGWGSSLTLKTSNKLEQLARKFGDQLNLFRALHITTTCELFSGRIEQAPITGKKSLAIAQELKRADLMAEAHRIIGQTLLFGDNLIESRDSFTQAITAGRSLSLRGIEYASDPIIISQIQKSHALWLLGYPDQAIKGATQAVNEAKKNERTYDQCICLFVSSFIYYWVGNLELSHKNALECQRLSEEFGNKMFSSEPITYLGATKVLQGEVEKGLSLIENAIATRKQRAITGINLHTSCFAELCHKVGNYDQGLKAIERSLTESKQTGERHLRSEVLRVKGDLLLAKKDESLYKEIESCYQDSLEISRKQSAKSLELRTAMSLAKFRKSQNRTAEGLELVKVVYSWFNEGHQTRDLLAAGSLIDELTVACALD